ncbi:MAG: methionyl-tRNA formyltransferase [Candidatus Paceibacterota bacterium]
MDNANLSAKYAFFGTPSVARDTLRALIEAGWKPELVVTSPDAPRGRGLVMTPSETKALAEEYDLQVVAPARLDEEAIASIKEYDCDFAIVVAYGKILPEALIRAFPKGVFNIHYSLLPKYRGASPVETALLNGETETGVTIQRMVYKLDAGDIVAIVKEKISPDDTTSTLRPRLIEAGANLLLAVLPEISSGEVQATPQEHDEATFAPKFKKEDGLLKLDGKAEENWRKYRAFSEWPGTYFFENDKRMKIKKARFEKGQFIVERVVPEGGKEVEYHEGGAFSV